MIELACPESCQYLHSAREQTIIRERELRPKEITIEGREHARIDRRLLPLIIAIDSAIVRTQRQELRDLLDLEVLQAIENALKNLETESSGLIYEHRTSSPRIRELSEQLRALPARMAEGGSVESRFTRSDLITALRNVRFVVESYIRRNEGTRSYLRYIALFQPWDDDTTGKLII